jgi:hypothetical protein
MRMRYLALLLGLFIPSLLHADGSRVHSFIAVANDASVNLVGSGISYNKVTWNKVGTVTVCVGKLQKSVDNSVWTDYIAIADCSVNGASLVDNTVVNYVRMITTSYTGTGTVTIRWNGYVANPSGGSLPAGSVNELQTNAGAGAFGAITGLTNGLAADCDGFMDTCFLHFSSSGASYLALSHDPAGPAGNYAYWNAFAAGGAMFNIVTVYDGTNTESMAVESAGSDVGVSVTGTTARLTAQRYQYPQGTIAACTRANTICEQAPAAVTPYSVVKPGISGQGTLNGTLTAGVITQGFSGDTNHSAAPTIGSGASIGSTSLCSTGVCPAGTYRVNTTLDITTACGTSGTYIVNLIYTDDTGTPKTVPVNIQGTGAVPATGVLTTTSTANFGQASQILRSSGAASINYSTTAVACGSAGPMVGKLYLSVEPVQ